MLPFERMNKIMDRLRLVGQIKVREDAGRFEVSQATLHRDLDRLEEKGLIKKVRGGAVLRQQVLINSHYDLRLKSYVEEKQKMAASAASFINNDSSIFLDHSTTVGYLARALAQRDSKNIIVVTNSLAVPPELADHPGYQVMLTGGVIQQDFRALSGRWVIESFRGFNFHQIFTGCGAVSIKSGFMTQTPFIHEILSEILTSNGAEINVMADYSKFHKIATFRMAPLSAAHRIITDRMPPKNMADKIQSQGPKLVAAA